jgi:hypothetical protein
MKSRTFLTVFVLIFAILWIVPGVFAQPSVTPCVSNVPLQVNLYESRCIQVCPDSEYVFFLVCPFQGEFNFPHLTLTPGCNSGGPTCNTECEPVVPPTWPWAPGQPPTFGQDRHAPDAIFVENECMQIYVYWSHHGYWVIEILTNNCGGCFCLYFDWQLPVNLNAFDAVAGNNEVSLNWATASESSNDHFEIVRDDAGVVGSVESQGNGATGHQYTWTDRTVVNGRTYTYHLRSVDMNGSRGDLRTTEATPTFTATGTVSSYSLYQNFPNPFNPSTQIAFDLPMAGNVRLDVFNPIGEKVGTLVSGSVAAGHYSVSFDGSNLTSGLYFYTITVGDKYTATRKMLLVK